MTASSMRRQGLAFQLNFLFVIDLIFVILGIIFTEGKKIIMQAFVRRTMSANILNLRRRQSLYPYRDSDRHRNLTICSLTHFQASLKISCKSVLKFLLEVANRETNDDENVSSLAEVDLIMMNVHRMLVGAQQLLGWPTVA